MMRLYLHPTSNVDDVQLAWINAKTFQVRLRWPIFMQKSLMMVDLDIDYNASHAVYTSRGKNAKSMRDEDGNIWSEGIFKFPKAMEDDFEDKLFVVEVDGQHNSAAILQIVFKAWAWG